MADEIIARSSSEFTRAPEGEYNAVCADVIDLGMIENKKFNKMEHRAALVFQLDALDDKGQRLEISQRFAVSMHEKAALRKFLSQWRGRSYTEAEAKDGVPLHKLEGQPAIITVEHKDSNGKTYANILSIRLPKKDDPRITAQGYKRDEYWTKSKAATAPQSDRETEQDEELDEIPF